MKGKQRPRRKRSAARRNPLAVVVRKLGARVKPSARSYSRKGKGAARLRQAEKDAEE